jgi:DNA-binding NtrC family response regulator
LIRELNTRHGCQVDGVEPEAMARLMGHSWPGNVRELRNALERAVIVAREGSVQLHQLPPTLGIPALNLPATDEKTPQFKFREGATLDEVERAYIQFTLSLIGNNKRRAAKILGIGERTLHSRVAE